MTSGPAPGLRSIRSWPPRTRLLVWLGGLLALAAGFAAAWALGWTAPPRAGKEAERAAAFERWFTAELDRAKETAAGALDARQAKREPRNGHGIAGRFEGAGQLDAEQHYLSWRGRPPEPWPGQFVEGASAWAVHRDGVHTRLVIRLDPDATGRSILAAFILDSRLDEYDFARLIPPSLLHGVQADVEFLDSRFGEKQPQDGGRDRIVLRAPDGAALGWAELHVADRAAAAARERRRAAAWFAALGTLLGWVLFGRPASPGTAGGLARKLGGVGLARLALLWTAAPAWLLPRELGSASVFGASAAAGLAASPGDLLLTAAAVYAAALALRDFATAALHESRRAAAGCAIGIGAAGALGSGAAMLLSIARNSSLALLGAPGPWGDPVRLVLASAPVLAALGAAELLALAWMLLRGLRPGDRAASRIAVGAVVAVLLLGGGVTLKQLEQRLALERVRSEYAPLVLEQRARRSVALSAAVRRVVQAFEGGEPFPRSGAAGDSRAYELWVGGELFFGGYKSSLAFYDAAGELVSYFGFELPSLDEKVGTKEATPGLSHTWDEPFDSVASVRQGLLHAQMPVFLEGRLAGTVVGHVVDEPDNLPFLPDVRPYLAALGPAAAHASTGLPEGGPDYVVYDSAGTVLLSTLAQPPAMTDALVQSFENDDAVRLLAGMDRVAGFAAQDELHRLHLLLLPTPTALARSAAAVRLVLLGLAWLGLATLLPRLGGLAAVGSLARSVRGSFYRKLLVALLLASMIPLVGLALLLRGTIEQRGRESLEAAATRYAAAAQRVLDDYAATALESEADYGTLLNDDIMDWLRNVVGQEILVYENGLLQATSKRELFTSGLLPPRLDGEVHRRLGREGLPSLVVASRLGPTPMPVAYAPVQGADPLRELVVAVPVLAEGQEIARATERVGEMLLLSTVLLGSLLAFVAAAVAGSVARPVRELVGATARIATGDYDTRLAARTRDEVAELVRGFNSMAASLASQRADLERRRDYMERLLQHATTGVISIDAQGEVVTLNPAARELLATPGGRLGVGQRLVDSLARTTELRPLAAALEARLEIPGEPEEIDLERAGQPRRLRLVRVDLPDPGGGNLGRLILLDDVTELMRSNQLAAWAEMARAIAHEIKNPLTPIQLSTEHLRRLLRDRGVLPHPALEACLDTVIKQVRTLYDIAGEFSAYARLPTLEPQPADAVAFMRAVVGPYRTAPPAGVTIEERYAEAGRVAIDERVLGRAVINLVENAIQAMPRGGELRAGVEPDGARDEVVLSIGDTGVGLSPEARRRLFEPYFSTKSSGTGLGLAIVRRAVEAHHGRVEVESAEGRGTTFRIHLPRVP